MTKTIGILHPGAMGAAVAQSMRNGGHEVLWCAAGRSAATQERAAAADLTAVDTLAEFCQRSEAIVVVCPPDQAGAVADSVIATGFAGLYVDANAIAPQTSVTIGRKLTTHNIAYVDGSIIGGPPRKAGTTWLYLSGERAAEAAAFFSAGPLETTVLGAEIGQASALKMCFAANTKAVNALQTATLATAEALGVREALEKQWTIYNGDDFVEKLHQRVTRTAHQKAWRFAGEMDEIAATFAAAGIPDGYLVAAAETYRRLAHFKGAEQAPDLIEMLHSLQV